MRKFIALASMLMLAACEPAGKNAATAMEAPHR